MVNEKFETFNKVQKKHIGEYLGTVQRGTPRSNDESYNNQEDTDKAIGATGRNQNLK